MSESEKLVTEKVRMGSNKHAFWCEAQSAIEKSPCLMIKASAIERGLTIDFDEKTHDVCINGPKELMVALMQDAYQSQNGKPFELRLARSLVKGISHSDDYVAFILNNDGEDAE